MRKFVILLLVALLALLAAVPAAAQDAEEDLLTLPALPVGEKLEDFFVDVNHANVYAFNGTAGDIVTLTMVQEEDSSLDPYLVLLGPAGQVIAANDDSDLSSDLTLSSRLSEIELPLSGTYLVLASTFANLEGLNADPLEEQLNYTIALEGANPPEELGTERIQLLGNDVAVDSTLNAAITQAEPVYYFFLRAEAGQLLNIFVASSTDGYDPIVMLVDGDGRRVAANDDGGNTESGAPLDAGIAGYEVLESGEFIIMVTSTDFENGADPEWDGAGEFGLSISVASGK